MGKRKVGLNTWFLTKKGSKRQNRSTAPSFNWPNVYLRKLFLVGMIENSPSIVHLCASRIVFPQYVSFPQPVFVLHFVSQFGRILLSIHSPASLNLSCLGLILGSE